MKEYESTSGDTDMLRQLFGDNRAEWPAAHFKQLFVEPTYLHKLESVRPCILVGGRGTGKTTSLQSLKYDATLDRLESSGLSFGDQEYLGILVRMNKNRVRAFRGGSVADTEWERVFAHYFNLLACVEFANLGMWLQTRSDVAMSIAQLNRVASDLGIEDVVTLNELRDSIRHAISSLQIYVNNPTKRSNVVLSMAEAPLRTFAEVLTESGLSGDRVIFCCIDEYENLLDYQQAVLNTYIKHAEPPLSYKVGVRKNGLRNRRTSGGQDLLRTPDDYADIEIADEGFEYFARAVAELRLRCAKERGVNVPDTLKGFLAELSLSDEALLLGAEKVSDQVLEELLAVSEDLHAAFDQMRKSDVYFLKYWQEVNGGDIAAIARDWLDNQAAWSTRIGNHGYASLFWLSMGRKGARIRKYYCGSRVFLALPAGNIRFFLELVDSAIGYQLEAQDYLPGKPLIISPKAQTFATRDVGRRKLEQLEGLADHGVELKRLVLAIGKVFFEFARSPVGRTPEITSFIVSGAPGDVARIQALLSEGVAHLAFEAAPRTKATSNVELRDDEYRLHRIFCGFFEISHRKKRRVTFNARHLLNILEEKPARAISTLLEGIDQTREDDLPEQLAFFNAFYDAASGVQ